MPNPNLFEKISAFVDLQALIASENCAKNAKNHEKCAKSRQNTGNKRTKCKKEKNPTFECKNIKLALARC
jgi:hypothetical protein